MKNIQSAILVATWSALILSPEALSRFSDSVLFDIIAAMETGSRAEIANGTAAEPSSCPNHLTIESSD